MVDQNLFILNTNGEQIDQDRSQKQIDKHQKNLDNIQKMQEKKALEQKIIEDERRKMIKRQEKLKDMILRQAAKVR